MPTKLRRTKPIQVKSLKRRVAQTNGSLISARPYSNLIRSTRKANYLHKLGWVWIPGIQQSGNVVSNPALKEALIGNAWYATGGDQNTITYAPDKGCGSANGGGYGKAPYSLAFDDAHFAISVSENEPRIEATGLEITNPVRITIAPKWVNGVTYATMWLNSAGADCVYSGDIFGKLLCLSGADKIRLHAKNEHVSTQDITGGTRPTGDFWIFTENGNRISQRAFTGYSIGRGLSVIEANHYGQVWHDCQKLLHPSRVI
jgi:hypothetical protein